MSLAEMLCLAAALPPIALAGYAIIRESRGPVRYLLMAGCVALAAESVMGAMAEGAGDAASIRVALFARLLIAAVTPWPWVLFSVSYSRGNSREYLKRWALPVTSLAVTGLVVGVAGHREMIREIHLGHGPGEWVVDLGRAAIAIYTLYLVGMIISLTNVERTLRAATGVMRWRIKYAILGLITLLVGRVYSSSQILLYSDIQSSLLSVEAIALILGGLVFGFSLSRGRLNQVDLYLSQKAIYQSLTFMAAGVYLVIVGLAAKIAYRFEQQINFPLVALVLIVALVGLSGLLMSDRVRRRINVFITTHFRRPRHDFRTAWMTLTERTASLVAAPEYCRASVRFLADTLDVLSVTIWLVDKQNDSVEMGGSTVLTEQQAKALSAIRWAEVAPAIDGLRASDYPVDLDQTAAEWAVTLRRWSPDIFGKGGGRVCMLLRAGPEVVGLLVVGDRISGVPFSTEDILLLQAMGDHVAAGLLNFRLAKRLLSAKEMEAFETLSAFLVHDLKNTASTLSLVLENMQEHYDDPEFRRDALQAVTRSVGKVNDVIRRLGSLRYKTELQFREIDLNALVRSAVTGMQGNRQIRLELNVSGVLKIPADADELQKVITNLVLNAFEATPEGGWVKVETRTDGAHAVLDVADSGAGMTSEFISQSLFRPFKTTKKNGMGIGLFQCRKIVESHNGRIEVESEAGRGSVFRVYLPFPERNA